MPRLSQYHRDRVIANAGAAADKGGYQRRSYAIPFYKKMLVEPEFAVPCRYGPLSGSVQV